MATPEGLFAAVLAAHPERPLVTWYDETPGRGARVELSARSLANWAAKTAGLVTDELGLGPGDRVFVDPVAHWVLPGLLAGIWNAGPEVVTTGAAGPLDAAVVARGAGTRPAADEVFTLDPASPLLLGAADDAPGSPPDSRDLPTALRPHPDRPAPARGAAGDAALDGRTRTDLAAAATARAGRLGLTPTAGRLLWSGPLAGDALVTAVLAPWAVGGSLVLVTTAPGVAAPTADRLAAIAATEGVHVLR